MSERFESEDSVRHEDHEAEKEKVDCEKAKPSHGYILIYIEVLRHYIF